MTYEEIAVADESITALLEALGGFEHVCQGLSIDIADLHRQADFHGIDRLDYVRAFLGGYMAASREKRQ